MRRAPASIVVPTALFALGLAGLPLALGCGTPGERARDGCPPDGICSLYAPSGLAFDGASLHGASLGTNPLAATAEGGAQRFVVRRANLLETLPPTLRVTSSDPSVLALDPGAGASFTARGLRAGTASIRVLDGADALVDRLTHHVEAPASATLVVTDFLSALAPEPRALVPWAGRQVLGVHLHAASGARLVDEDLVLDAPPPSTARRAWDTFEVELPAAGLTLTALTGDARLDASIAAATRADGLEAATWLLAPNAAGEPEVDAGGTFCAVPRAGEARVVGGPAVAFTVDGAAVPTQADGRCVTLPASLGATAALTATFEGASARFTFPVGRRTAR